MEKMKKIQINAAIFPKVMTVMLGKEKKRENETGEQINSFSDINPPELIIDLPRSVSLLYLHHISDSTERRLLEQYAYGIPFSDEDFKDLFQIIFVNVNRTWGYSKEENDVLGQFGISITKEDEKSKLVLIEDAIPQIRVETWECIIVDLLHEAAMEIINCFDFDSTYIRKIKLPDGENKLHFSLGAWQFSPDQDEQKLSNALRTAFIFTLVSFNFGDVRNQYNNFSDFFDAEFYKRVSLIHSIWISKKKMMI